MESHSCGANLSLRQILLLLTQPTALPLTLIGPAFAVVYSSYFYADSQVAALASASSGVESDVSSASLGPLSSSYGSAETPIALCLLLGLLFELFLRAVFSLRASRAKGHPSKSDAGTYL